MVNQEVMRLKLNNRTYLCRNLPVILTPKLRGVCAIKINHTYLLAVFIVPVRLISIIGNLNTFLVPCVSTNFSPSTYLLCKQIPHWVCNPPVVCLGVSLLLYIEGQLRIFSLSTQIEYSDSF